jgi:hypothetical protein
MKKDTDLVQFNTRVPKVMKDAVKLISKETGFPAEDIAQDAFALYYGEADDLVLARHKRCMAAIKKLKAKGVHFFEHPDLAGGLAAYGRALPARG